MLLSLRQFRSFLLVGAASTLIHYLMLWILVDFGRVDPVRASSAGYPISCAINYYFNYSVTFGSHTPHYHAISKFIMVSLSGLVLNGLIIYLGTEIMAINYLIAQVMATGLVTVCNFCGHRNYSFK